MSNKASGWAWETRTGNSTRKLILAAFADYASADGTSAYPSLETIADRVECSVRTVQRQLQTLLADGFMRPGDQDLVSHIRADKRPVVYDLAMSDLVRQQWKAAAAGDVDQAPERGVRLSPREIEAGVSDCHPGGSEPGDAHVTPSTSHGVTPVTERGDTGVTQFGSEQLHTPQPPAERGAGSVDCKRCTAGLPCRPHGTTPRQLEAAERRAAAERRRLADQAEAEADRARRAAAAAVDSRTYVQQARAGIQGARRVQ